jgi:hypothetical protein
MHGIPTTFNHNNMRSRLEAKWACMFEKLGWKYIYEPFDLDGWIPDFLITGKKKVFVEVKPFIEFKEWEQEIKTIESALRKANMIEDYLLLGANIGTNEVYSDTGSLGYYAQECQGCWDVQTNSIFYSKEKYGMEHAYMDYTCPITGLKVQDDGGERLTLDQLENAFKECGNEVQWKPNR